MRIKRVFHLPKEVDQFSPVEPVENRGPKAPVAVLTARRSAKVDYQVRDLPQKGGEALLELSE